MYPAAGESFQKLWPCGPASAFNFGVFGGKVLAV
jgi:hypothetical protein